MDMGDAFLLLSGHDPEFPCSNNETLSFCMGFLLYWQSKREAGLSSMGNPATDGKGKKNWEGIQSLKHLSTVRYTDWLFSKPNVRLVANENVEEEPGGENQMMMTENLECFSEVVLSILVILPLSMCEAPPLFVHVKIHAVARQALFIFYYHRMLRKKCLSSSVRDKGRAMAQHVLVVHSRVRKPVDSWRIPRLM